MTTDQTIIISFEFNIKGTDHVFDAHVISQTLEKHIRSPKDLDKLGEKLCKKLGVENRDEYDQRIVKVMPLTMRGQEGRHPFQGLWSIGSPVGMENQQPPGAWMFTERLKLVQGEPQTYPLLQGQFLIETCKSKKIAKDLVGAVLQDVLGDGAVRKIDTTTIPTRFDNYFGGFGGYG